MGERERERGRDARKGSVPVLRLSVFFSFVNYFPYSIHAQMERKREKETLSVLCV